MPLKKFGLYWHTLRYLKPVQILGRFRFQLTKPKIRQHSVLDVRPRENDWICCARKSSMPTADGFIFLNQRQELAWPEGWECKNVSRLWLYNLHYFDDLVANDWASRQIWHTKLIANWIDSNPPGQGVGWEPYPISLRVVNWIKWQISGASVPEEFISSLAEQLQWLSRNIENHIQANHLWANAKGLIFAGAFFQSVESSQWLATGIRILDQELNEQVLADGGHYERSPMYHAIVLEDVLDLIQLAKIYPSVIPASLYNQLEQVIPKMLRWLKAMSHEDGGVGFFNDSTNGIAPTLEQLEVYAESLGIESGAAVPAQSLQVFDETGYLRMSRGELSLICDTALIGPDYQPGHAHADTLSFECSLYEKRFLVNSGIDRYEEGDARSWQRSTAAHNTVDVDGENSSEVWKSFRVARRARPFDIEISEKPDRIAISCKHDGYTRLPGKVVHQREWVLEDRCLTIKDQLTGAFQVAIARFHIHPDIQIDVLEQNTLRCFVDGKNVSIEVMSGKPQLVSSTYHPEFGLSIPNNCLEIEFSGSELTIRIRWN